MLRCERRVDQARTPRGMSGPDASDMPRPSPDGAEQGLVLGVDRLGFVDVFLTDVRGELFPDGLHRGDPGFALRVVQFTDHTTGIDNRLFGFAGTADGEPSGQYIENLTSLVPQPVAQAPAAPPQPVVAATTSQHAPFSMQQHQGAPAAPVAPVRQQMIQSEPVKLEHSGQQNLLGIDEDVDLPPFLRR